jgi:peptidoglycan hydrolase-like protein with peptidoglycan-binding domain
MIRVALAVVLICLAGAAWAQENFSRDEVRSLQRALRDQGYELGTVDGLYGTGTATAIRQYQVDKGLAQTAVITQDLLDRLKEEAPGSVDSWRKTTN